MDKISKINWHLVFGLKTNKLLANRKFRDKKWHNKIQFFQIPSKKFKIEIYQIVNFIQIFLSPPMKETANWGLFLDLLSSFASFSSRILQIDTFEIGWDWRESESIPPSPPTQITAEQWVKYTKCQASNFAIATKNEIQLLGKRF